MHLPMMSTICLVLRSMSSAVDLVLSKSIQIALAWSKVNANSSTSILICLYKSYLVSNTAPHDYATAGVFDVSLINIWLLRGHTVHFFVFTPSCLGKVKVNKMLTQVVVHVNRCCNEVAKG
jgi:hypothetical protein